MEEARTLDLRSKQAVRDEVLTPVSGVHVSDRLLRPAFENNLAFLKSLSMDSMLYWFRRKAGQDAPGEPYRGHFEDNIKGQTAGLFLMGAGNALRWREDAELRSMMKQILTCVEDCRDDDGYLMAVPKQEFGTKEYPGYVRAWLTFGLVAAGLSGDDRASRLLREWQDWFNRCGELRVIRYLHLAYQGISASTAAYFSPIGTREDIEIAEEYYPEGWRLAQFILRDPDAVHIRRQPGKEPHPHGSELTSIEGYVDLYRATGNYIYLNAALGAHELYRRSWQHVGGGIVMIEFQDMSPGCYWLDPKHKYNELCCSAYWIYLNQRLHRLFPEEELYPAEIERTLYNVILADQAGTDGIRYHAYLEGRKDDDWKRCRVSCCAGTGTRVLASLPEFLYSIAPDGLLVNMYAASEIAWRHEGVRVDVRTETGMPFDGAVAVRVDPEAPVSFALKLRIPGWAAGPVRVELQDGELRDCEPGTQCVLNRLWRGGDVVSLRLPMALRATRYTGAEQAEGFERYAFEYGPVLLTATDGQSVNNKRRITLDGDPEHPEEWLRPMGKDLTFAVEGNPDRVFVPYFGISDQEFTCYPLFTRRPFGI